MFLRNIGPPDKENFLWRYCRRHLEYTGSGYEKYRQRISLARSLLGEKYQTEGLKHWLLASFIRLNLIWPVYLYYFEKNRYGNKD